MTNNQKILANISLAQKAHAVASGEFATEKAVKEQKAFLVIVATDSSNNTKKKFKNMCHFYKVPYIEISNKEELGHYIGKEFRASLAICNQGFSKSIQQKITDLQLNNGGN